MKLRLIMYALFLSVGAYCEISHAQESNNSTATQAQPSIKEIKSERDKWTFLRMQLQFELDQATTWTSIISSFVENHPNFSAELYSAPITLTAYVFAYQVFKMEELMLAGTMAGIGTVLYGIFRRYIIPPIGRFLSHKNAIAARALNKFMESWEDYRDKCPTEVHRLFDQLALEFDANDMLVSITNEQASMIVETTISEAILGEQAYQMSLAYLKPKPNPPLRTSEDTEESELESNPSAFLSSMFNASLSVLDGPALKRDQNDEYKSQKSHWEYLAKKLGILNNYNEEESAIKKFFHDFELFLTYFVGVPAGILAGSRLVRFLPNVREIDTEVILGGQLVGGLVGGAVVSFLSFFIGKTNPLAWHTKKLTAFVDQWPNHKQHCPPSVIPLFNQLSALYSRNNQQLNLDERFVEELYRMIAKIWLKLAAVTDDSEKGKQ